MLSAIEIGLAESGEGGADVPRKGPDFHLGDHWLVGYLGIYHHGFLLLFLLDSYLFVG